VRAFSSGDLRGWGNWELSAARSRSVLASGAQRGAKF
jgi:flagellar motor protein MotB